MGIFDNLLTNEFKSYFNDSIDYLLSDTGLTRSCLLVYSDRLTNENICNNCILDPIYKKSTGHYNSTGPKPFNNSICPVCNGDGFQAENDEEAVSLAVLFTEKSWIKTLNLDVKIPDGSIQSICSASLAQKINNSSSLILSDNNGINRSMKYERFGDVSYIGFHSNDYIVTMWKKL